MRIGEYPHDLTAGASNGLYGLLAATGEDVRVSENSVSDHEQLVLRQLGIARPWITRFARQADINGTTIEAELLASGLVTEESWYGALARMLALPFTPDIDPELLVDSEFLDVQLNRPCMVRLNHTRRSPEYAIVPRAGRLDELFDAMDRMPELGHTMVVTTPSALKKAVWQAGQTRRVRETCNSLFEQHPRFSARVVFHGIQGFWAGLLLSAFTVSILLAPAATLPVLHLIFSLVYLATLLLRFAALVHKRRKPVAEAHVAYPDHELPVYTVLVALYKEEAVCEQLVSALSRLSWPPSKLDIKLVCEADDRATIEKLHSLSPGPHFEIVEVPLANGPRTKPRALSYALAAARGEYVAIYDAEDRPHPEQLREAHSRFSTLPTSVACLQAPLIITNARESWISALFSLEYSALFRGLLPMLAKHDMPLPLGGTSNHFSGLM